MSTSIDAELSAMQKVLETLEALAPEQRERVITWVISRLGPAPKDNRATPVTKITSNGRLAQGLNVTEFAELFDVCRPSEEKEKVLIAGYWYQFIDGNDSFDSQSINRQLKHLGHGIKNVTSAFTRLMKEKPALAIQIRKSGGSKQSRKLYKVTDAGKKYVDAMMSRDIEE